MDRRGLLAGTAALVMGLASGCLDTLSGGRFSSGVDPADLTGQKGEVVEVYEEAVDERNDGVRTRDDAIVAFNDEEYGQAIDQFETAIEHFEAARAGFGEAATLAYEIAEDEVGAMCETAEEDAELQIAATQAALNAAEAADGDGTAADVNGHVEEYRDRLEQAEAIPVEDPQTLVDTIESS